MNKTTNIRASIKVALALALGLGAFSVGAMAHDPGSSGAGTPTCLESNFMLADAMNAPFSNIPGPGRVIEMNTTTGDRGITVNNPFGAGTSPVCQPHVHCPGGPMKPTGIVSGGENGHAYLTSAAQHALTEFHRDGTPIRTNPVWPTDPTPDAATAAVKGHGWVPRLLGNGFMPNGNIAQTICDANFFNASNSDSAPDGDPLEANHYFPPVNGTEARSGNGRVLIIDQETLAAIDEYTKPTSGPFANDPRWNCPAGVIFTSEGMFVSMFHGDAIFVIDWKAGINKQSRGTGANKPLNCGSSSASAGEVNCSLKLGKKKNEAVVLRVIDISNDGGPAGNLYALNYYDAPAYDSGHRRDNLRAIRMSEDGTLWGTRRSRSAECGRDAGCNPGVFRQHIFAVDPGSNTRSGSIALDPGVNVIAGLTINRMSGPGCKKVTGNADITTEVSDLCDVETLYVGVSAGNAGCTHTSDVPPNRCFEPHSGASDPMGPGPAHGALVGGGTVYEYRIDKANWDATDGSCDGNPATAGMTDTGCAQPIAQFVFRDGGGNEETLDPRMVMTIHEAFVQ